MSNLNFSQLDQIAHVKPGQTAALAKQFSNLSKAEQEKFKIAFDYLARGRRIPGGLVEKLLPVIEKVNLKYHVEWEDVVHLSGLRLKHRKLQTHYQEYLTRTGKTPTQSPPSAWARRTRSAGAKKLLRQLLGDNYKRVISSKSGSAKVFTKLGNIARPASLTDKKLARLITILRVKPKLLTRRLGKFFNSPSYSDDFVSIGHMSNAKGNIGEIFALLEQQKLVKEFIQNMEKAGMPFARKIELVTDIRINGKEFSDNLIGYIENGNLETLGAVEVKNYTKPHLGLEKAKSQFFEWLESKIDEGVTMTAKFRGKEYSFTYDPAMTKGKVKGLYSSKKYILYIGEESRSTLVRYSVGYSGRSPMGLDLDDVVQGKGALNFDNGKRTVGNVTVWPVTDVTTAELDYLAALLIKTKGSF